LKYESTEEFLADIRKKFEEGNKETIKVVELKRLEQEEKMMEKFIQEFKRATRDSGYEGRPLVKEFQKGINGTICYILMETEQQPTLIKQ